MTGDRAALLAAVLAAPDDDAPRLVYADALDDAGEHDRAELIRLQIRHSGTPTWANLSPEKRFAAKGRYSRAVAEIRRRAKAVAKVGRPFGIDVTQIGVNEWVVVAGTGGTYVKIHRGFAESVRFSVHDWLAHAPALLLSHPVRTVTLTTRAVLAADANGWAEPADEAYFRRRWPRIRFVMPPPDAPLYRNFGTEAAPRWERYE